MKRRFRTIVATMLSIIMLFSCTFIFTACKGEEEEPQTGYQANPNLNKEEQVELRIVGSSTTWAQMDAVITSFNEIYPNCRIVYDCIDSYTNTLPIRLSQADSMVDIFTTINIQQGSNLEEFALNLISEQSRKFLDLSKCNDGLVNNYKYTAAENIQYAVPYSGLMRGMFVNKTLLELCGLTIPTNRAEFLNCCKVLVEQGYVALQCPPENLGQQMLYPSMCNKIANAADYQATWNDVQNCEDNISELFREEYEFFYNMVKKGYINFASGGKAKAFLNIEKQPDGTYVKVDDIGNIGFVVDTQSMAITLDKDIIDYHSTIEYQFVVTPIGEDGGYAYLSPSDGLAINKNSQHVDWALEFLNFIFTPEVNTVFSEASGFIPNTKNAMLKYNISPDRMSTVGQVTFDYGAAPNFYNTVTMLTRNGYAYNNSGVFVDAYASVNENYRSVFTEETYYRKLADAVYEPVDATYLAQYPKSAYRMELGTYTQADPTYIVANPTETFYRKVTHVAIDSAYIEEHPDEKIYRRIEPMEGMAYMRVRDADGNYILKPDGTYEVKYTLEQYMDRLEKEFQVAKAYKYGASR